MKTIEFDSTYFNIKDTLDCGQIFRYKPYKDGYLVFSRDTACYVYTKDDKTVIQCEDEEYFKKYFDLDTDYLKINDFALSSPHNIVKTSATQAKGVRILRQDSEEMLFSFIISQNNMIPRIKAIIERTCEALGEEKYFYGEKYYTFPSFEVLAKYDAEFYKKLGYGYRAEYISEVANVLGKGDFNLKKLENLKTFELKKSLLTLKGVGPKVADCISLFGYHRTDSFPVDTWIEKLYYEDFGGTLKDRKKITEYFLNEFGDYSGYIQQYVFYYKRSLSDD